MYLHLYDNRQEAKLWGLTIRASLPNNYYLLSPGEKSTVLLTANLFQELTFFTCGVTTFLLNSLQSVMLLV